MRVFGERKLCPGLHRNCAGQTNAALGGGVDYPLLGTFFASVARGYSCE